jgi:hypothetical protein
MLGGVGSLITLVPLNSFQTNGLDVSIFCSLSLSLEITFKAVNEVAIDNAKVTGCGIALDPHLVVGRRLLNNRDSSPKTILPERSTRMAIAGRQSPIATQWYK